MYRLVTARTASMSSVHGLPLRPTRPSDRVVIYESFARSVSRVGFGSPGSAGLAVRPLQGVHQLEGDALDLLGPLVGELEDGVDVLVEGRLVEVAEQHDHHGHDLVDLGAGRELAPGVGRLD